MSNKLCKKHIHMTHKHTKNELRENMLRLRNELPEEAWEEKSNNACEQLFSMNIWKIAKVIFCFISVDKEVDTDKILQRAYKEGKVVLAPRCLWDDRTMLAVPLYNTEELKIGCHDIPEPPHDREEYKDEIDLVIVPGLAFDDRGHRVGYGASYYDIFFSRNNHRINAAVGISFDFQIVDKVPNEDHDFPLCGLVNDKGIVKNTHH